MYDDESDFFMFRDKIISYKQRLDCLFDRRILVQDANHCNQIAYLVFILSDNFKSNAFIIISNAVCHTMMIIVYRWIIMIWSVITCNKNTSLIHNTLHFVKSNSKHLHASLHRMITYLWRWICLQSIFHRFECTKTENDEERHLENPLFNTTTYDSFLTVLCVWRMKRRMKVSIRNQQLV